MANQTHQNLRQVVGKIPRELNDILRQIQDSLRGLRGFDGEIELSNSISLTKISLGSALKMFSSTIGGALGISSDNGTLHISRGGYRNSTGAWIASDVVAVVLELTAAGTFNLYRNEGLVIGGQFTPLLVGAMLPPGLSPSSSVITITNNYAVVAGVTVILVDASSGPINVTLPPIASANGRSLYVKKIDSSANFVTVAGDADIDGDADFDLMAEDESIEVVADSSEWWII